MRVGRVERRHDLIVITTSFRQQLQPARCVLAFSMGRAAFPVDTHVHRIAARLGWIPPGTTADKAYRILSPAVPPDIRYDLHMARIVHGRTVCSAQRPRCAACVLLDQCAYASGGPGNHHAPLPPTRVR